MRKAINENPVIQLSLLGVLVVVVGLLLVTRVMKKEEKAEPGSPTATPAGAVDASAAGTAAPATSGAPPPAGAVPGATPAAVPAATPAAPPVASTGTVTPEALIPGPGLPRDVVAAWKRGDAIVLLIVRGPGTDDRLVRTSVQALSGDPELSVFVARAKSIARYSRITQGVGISRVPALVVVRPKELSGAAPEAQVSYGFRSSQSVVQAVNDALYSGRDDIPYNPG
jgi:hypothetical protein